MPIYKPRLVLRVIWNSQFSGGKELARNIYSCLCRDVERPASRGISIPVYFYDGFKPTDLKLPPELGLSAAESTVVIVLIDSSMHVDSDWIDFVRSVEKQLSQSGRNHLFLPIACEERVHTVVERTSCIRLYETEMHARQEKLVSALTHEVARLLLQKNRDFMVEGFGLIEMSYAPVKFFISHSKHGAEGLMISTELRDYCRQHLPIATFYDSNDIAAGYDLENEIKANVAHSAMIIVHTDTYSDRSWCRKEVLLSKQYGCPILLVSAIVKGEERLFPYLGNAPTLRWLPDSPRRCEIVFDSALREVLRNLYFVEHVRTLKRSGLIPETYVEVSAAPEMLTYRNLLRTKRCDRGEPSVILYPDPPLGDEEIEVLDDLNPSNLTFTTPTTSPIQSFAPRSRPIEGSLVGISISNSSDLRDFGMNTVHLEDAMVECARNLLAQGASLAYGGDLRPGGFTSILAEMVRAHNRGGKKERIHNFIAWPIHLSMPSASFGDYVDEIKAYRLPAPSGLPFKADAYVSPEEIEGRKAWARSLTAMRFEMNSKTRARMFLGGQVLGFKGRYPGVFEEALIGLHSGRPVYLFGGFGGCTRLISQAIRGGSPEQLTEQFQSKDQTYRALIEWYRVGGGEGNSERIDYAGELQFLHSIGIAGLNNGLSDDENEVLFTSGELPHVVYLLLKGLVTCLR